MLMSGERPSANLRMTFVGYPTPVLENNKHGPFIIFISPKYQTKTFFVGEKQEAANDGGCSRGRGDVAGEMGLG